MEPLISIIVPVYKVEQYLDQCVKSIVDQTYRNLEIILVDDGSPDACPGMCDAWEQKDDRIKVIHKKNGGASSARNVGLDIAKGEYIGFVDGDDLIADNMYEVMLRAFEGEQVGMVCCSAQCISGDGELLSKKAIPSQRKMNIQQSLDAIFTLQVDLSVWSKLYRRDVLDGIRFPEGETNEEVPMTLPSIVKANGMIHVQDWLYLYRLSGDSVTRQAVPSEKNSCVVYRNFRKVEEQLQEYGMKKIKSFRFFTAECSYSRALYYEKRYQLLSDKIKKDCKVYREIMWRNAPIYLFSRYSLRKDKVLYVLVMTRMLRPVYKLFLPERL